MTYRSFKELSSREDSTVQEVKRCAINQNDPLQMCMMESMDRKFEFGGAVGNQTGAKSRKCQQYMAERCAKNWDGFCEYFYRNHNDISVNPISRPWEVDYGFDISRTTGENLLRNTAEVKYCSFPTCQPQTESFNPVGLGSNTLTYTNQCTPSCTVDPTSIDTDPVMNRLLEKPLVAAGTLVNICNTSRYKGIDLSGTRIGQFCDAYQTELQKLNQEE